MSNIPSLSGTRVEGLDLEHVTLPKPAAVRGLLRTFLAARHCDVILVNNEMSRVYALCILKCFLPFAQWKLVSLDALLPVPTSRRDKVLAWIKKFILRKVDRFILYFTDLVGYEKHYGISAERSTYVPFKVNIWDRINPDEPVSSEGDYVLMAGRTLRDVATFLRAMSIVGYPGVLLHQEAAEGGRHGTTVPWAEIPVNVRAVEHDGDQSTWVEYIRHARILAIPTLASTISSTGISTYLDAMVLNKAVVLTEGPATRGLIQDEAIVVSPGDPQQLAVAIRDLWEGMQYRAEIAGKGRGLAIQRQGEQRLLKDILVACAETVAP